MHKVVIKGNYYGRTRTLPDLNDYLQASSDGCKNEKRLPDDRV